MRFFSAVLVFGVLIFAHCGASAAPPAEWTKVLSALPAAQRVQGTVTVQGYQPDIGLGGGVATARVFIDAPTSLRVEVQPDAARGVRGIVAVAQGDTTRLYDPVSKRVREMPYNALAQWWRGWSVLFGGPTNAFFAGFSPAQLPGYYEIENSAARTFTLRATDDKAQLQPDSVRIGGGGDDIFYAPFLLKTWNYAPQVTWKFDEQNLPTQRTEGFADRELYRTAFTFDRKTGLPATATVTDFGGRAVAKFTYQLEIAAQPFDKSTFTLPQAEEQIAEAADIASPAAYKETDSTSIFNRGVALALNEDFAGAYAAWQRASQLSPRAVAPWFALYQSALQTHDLARAQSALQGLRAILGAENEDVLTRQASLAIALLQRETATSALQTLVKAHPENSTYLLALANFQRTQGTTAQERGTLSRLLALENAPHGAQAAAALSWAQNALTRVDRTAADLGNATPAQQLVHQMIEVINGKKDANTAAFADSPSLLTSLALIQESMGQKTAAETTWTQVAKQFPYPLDSTARWHLMALAAQRGDAEAAMQQYKSLRATAFGEEAVRLLQDQTIGIWQKAFGQEKLEGLLKARALAMRATEDDAKLWLAFQNTFGSREDVAAAITNGVTRFPQNAWWQSQRAEAQSSLATSSDLTGTTKSADDLLGEAVAAVDKAIALDAAQPYYAIQKALILRSIALSKSSIVVDVRKAQEKTNAAIAAYEKFAAKWPENSDVRLAAAIVRLPLDAPEQRAATLGAIDSLMRSARPLQASYMNETLNAPAANHMRAFTARQAKAVIARRQGDFDAMDQYYQELLTSSRDAAEEQGVAINYLRQALLRNQKTAVVNLLIKLAHEPWKWDDISTMFNATGSVIALNPAVALEVIDSLQAQADPYAHWAAARLAATLGAALNLALRNPQAPDALQGQQNSANNALKKALESLTGAVDGNDRLLAARAANALGESALERALQGSDETAIDAAKNAAQWFAKAIAADPAEMTFSKNRLTALQLAGEDAEAKNVATAALARLTLDPEAMRQAAKLTVLTAKDEADRKRAAMLASAAFLLAQNSPQVPISTFWRAGITAARIQTASGNFEAAETLYRQLSLPQWATTDRAVAYLDWQYQFKNAGRDSEAAGAQQMLESLGLNNPQLRSIQQAWQMLD